jgi:ribA/ribD-fused uncharacterized protein
MLGKEDATTPYLKEIANVQHWDVMACQFAIHYACKDEETFKTFIQNVSNHCKSVFFGTCMDGMSVYSLLAGKDRYILRSSGRTFAQIDKKYDDEGEWKDEFGQEIEVMLESTDKPIVEFLVPFQKIVQMFEEAGFELLETKMFKDLYVGQSGISLDASKQEFTSLHRTFAFKRIGEMGKKKEEDVVEIEVPEMEEAKEEEEEEEKKEEEEEEVKIVEKTEKKVTLKKKEEEAPKESNIVYFFSKEPENKEFSSFYDTIFKLDDVEYKSAEHALQAIKAKTFGDEENFKKIVKAKSAQSAKSFGKKVEKFDEKIWDEKKEDVMRQILRAKFSQNPEARKKLLNTGDKTIANADPRDNYWGIGTSATTTIAKNPSKWKGENKLGKLLMELREELRAEDEADEAAAAEKEEE